MPADQQVAVACATGPFAFEAFNNTLSNATIAHCKAIWKDRGCRIDHLKQEWSSNCLADVDNIIKAHLILRVEGYDEMVQGGINRSDWESNPAPAAPIRTDPFGDLDDEPLNPPPGVVPGTGGTGGGVAGTSGAGGSVAGTGGNVEVGGSSSRVGGSGSRKGKEKPLPYFVPWAEEVELGDVPSE